ncbi:U6 snRNA-associated Sm-like protein LSm4 isoform X4 [Xenopus laevis]|uniref:U6 snRNA-associated Sm-like protein LSm4 isoform X4 n=1 Tax=Xenopus laevis TaxID=8355 RepID=A0A8J1KL70_XENLA|nr:U6 snRNA-associated Sm-like protein LSm4 isoform X4 [Xenopus laevis]
MQRSDPTNRGFVRFSDHVWRVSTFFVRRRSVVWSIKQLPLSLLKTAQNHPMDGDKFWRMPECYIRGSTIKYLRIPDEIIDMVKEEVMSKGRGRGGMQQQKQMKGRGAGGGGRGVFGGRGRGTPGGGRGQQDKKPGRQSGKQ